MTAKHSAPMKVADALRAANQHRGLRGRASPGRGSCAVSAAAVLRAPPVQTGAPLRARPAAAPAPASAASVDSRKKFCSALSAFSRSYTTPRSRRWNERSRRQIHHHDFIRLLHHPVRNRLAHADAADLPDLVVQALQVLDVHRRQNIDAGLEQHLHVFPSLGALRAGTLVCGNSSTSTRLSDAAPEWRSVSISSNTRTAIFDLPARDDFQALRSWRWFPCGRAVRNSR